MKFSDFVRVFALSGLAAAGVVVVCAQQPSPISPATKPPGSIVEGAQAPSTPAIAPGTAVAQDTVVLTIGERKLTRAQFEQLQPEAAPSATTPDKKRKVAEQYGELETMAQEARKRMLDQSPEAKQLISIQVDNVLANLLAKKINDETQFTDLDLHAYYDAHKEEFEEAKGSHILIRFKGSAVPLKPNAKDLTEAEALAKAQEIRAKIAAGADFAALAKTESDDTGSATKGGDLGTFKHGQMVAPFDHAAFTLAVGEVSEPVRTNFGYHLIKISSRSSKTYEEAKPEIEKQLKPKMARAEVDKIKAKSPVTLNDEYFGK